MHEIPFKQWLSEQSRLERVCLSTIYKRYYRGQYPDVKLRRVNKRVVFVQVNGEPTCPTCGKPLANVANSDNIRAEGIDFRTDLAMPVAPEPGRGL